MNFQHPKYNLVNYHRVKDGSLAELSQTQDTLKSSFFKIMGKFWKLLIWLILLNTKYQIPPILTFVSTLPVSGDFNLITDRLLLEKGFKNQNRNPDFPKTIPVLVTGTGIYFLHSGSGLSGTRISTSPGTSVFGLRFDLNTRNKSFDLEGGGLRLSLKYFFSL